MRARALLVVSAILAWFFGLMLLFNTRAFEAPVGIVVTDKVATMAQAQGAILLGLGLINWLSRSVADVRALRAVLAGNLVVQLASLAVALRALLLGIFPIQGAPAVAIHVILGGAFALYLLRLPRAEAAAAAGAT
ncbi:MAG TPA: hypothetical protein VF832_03755 [Longimicrobiales bacterium]